MLARKIRRRELLLLFKIAFVSQKSFSIYFFVLVSSDASSLSVLFFFRYIFWLNNSRQVEMNGKKNERDFYNGNVKTAKVFVNYMQLGFAMDFSCLPHASHFFSLYENVVPGKNGNHFVLLSPSPSFLLPRWMCEFSFTKTAAKIRFSYHHFNTLTTLHWMKCVVVACVVYFQEKVSMRLCRPAQKNNIVQKLFSAFYSTKLLKQWWKRMQTTQKKHTHTHTHSKLWLSSYFFFLFPSL